ncbi:MAG TPA: citrate synthase family protein [Thermoanaerobaculia bacterium]|jgi:citrate synthase|nr:citrate synthase family protein [Thermoanaerobaculia bacterium]
MKDATWLSAAEAAKRLGVSVTTLYAYVSRGFIRSEPSAGKSRARRYRREDVERLRSRNEERRDPAKAGRRALHWGVPVLESAITLIANGKLYYRGHDVAELARTCTVEQVASLIWTGAFDSDIFGTPLHVIAGGRSEEGLPFINRCQSILPLVAARDSLAWDLRPRSVAQTGWRILNLLTSVGVESAELEETIEETLVREWAPKAKQSANLVRAAIILSADHELNVSSFTARCVASAGANPYSVVLGGLAAIEGVKHGGLSARVETLWDESRRARDLRRALGDRLRRGETIDGFGHRLYTGGDPRAQVLLEMLAESFPKSKDLELAQSFVDAAQSLLGEQPTIDFALVAMCRTLRLPSGAPLALFALGRTIGWIGHAIEQYAEGAIIRPRAKYTGPAPE